MTSPYASDPGDSNNPICCAGWSGSAEGCIDGATEEVDGDPYCAIHGAEARAQRDESERAVGVGLQDLAEKLGLSVEELKARRLERAKCGCDLVQCDPCGQMFPRGEMVNLSAEQSGAAQCDTTCCAACRGADPEDVHPTCETCGSCDECDCNEKPAREPCDACGMVNKCSKNCSYRAEANED